MAILHMLRKFIMMPPIWLLPTVAVARRTAKGGVRILRLPILPVMPKHPALLPPVLAAVAVRTIVPSVITSLRRCMAVGLLRMMTAPLVTAIPTAVAAGNLLSPAVRSATEMPTGLAEVIPIAEDPSATPT